MGWVLAIVVGAIILLCVVITSYFSIEGKIRRKAQNAPNTEERQAFQSIQNKIDQGQYWSHFF